MLAFPSITPVMAPSASRSTAERGRVFSRTALRAGRCALKWRPRYGRRSVSMSSAQRAGAWIVRKPPSGKARPRLFCFPYAGGGASAYRGWAEALPSLEVCAVQAPGRETRIGEAPLTRLEPLADAATAAIRPLLDRPFAFFGYSLGGFVA